MFFHHYNQQPPPTGAIYCRQLPLTTTYPIAPTHHGGWQWWFPVFGGGNGVMDGGCGWLWCIEAVGGLAVIGVGGGLW